MLVSFWLSNGQELFKDGDEDRETNDYYGVINKIFC